MSSPEELPELKIWIIIRKDLEMPAGKLAAQACHAVASLIYKFSNVHNVMEYMSGSQAKICVGVDNHHDLMKAFYEINDISIYFSPIIRDEGRTVFNEPTDTCFAVGPCYKEQLPKFIKRLRLY